MTVTLRLYRANPNGTLTLIADTIAGGINVPVNLVTTDYPDPSVFGYGSYTYVMQALVQPGDAMQYANLNLSGLQVKK